MHVIPIEFDYVDVAKRHCVGGDSYVFESTAAKDTRVEVVVCEDVVVEGTPVYR